MRRTPRQVNALAASGTRVYIRVMLRALRFLTGFTLLAQLAACATPETRVRQGLVEAGLSEPMANCMARPLARDLSRDQLRKLGSLGRTRNMDLRHISFEEFIYRVRALQDPEIIRITASAALGCTLR